MYSILFILFCSWEAVSSAYDFDTDSDPSAIADAVAREKWTKEFWARLRR